MSLATPPTSSAPLPPTPADPVLMSEQEYWDWAIRNGNKHTEWVAGKVVFKMPIDELHDMLQRALAASLEALARRRGLGHVRGENFAMRLPDPPSLREPDVLFVALANEARLSRTLLQGPADLVIEIVSPESNARDYRQKFLEYEAGGVTEYWIVNPLAKTVEAYRLVDGKYADLQPNLEGKLQSSVVPGWWLQASLLFRDPPPPPDALELMQALGVV